MGILGKTLATVGLVAVLGTSGTAIGCATNKQFKQNVLDAFNVVAQKDYTNSLNNNALLSEEVENLRADLITKQNKITALNLTISNQDAQIASNKVTINNLRADITTTQNTVLNLTAQKTELTNQINVLNSTITTQENDITNKSATIASLNISLENVNSQLATANSNLSNKQTMYLALQTQNETLIANNSALAEQKATLENQVIVLQNQIDALQSGSAFSAGTVSVTFATNNVNLNGINTGAIPYSGGNFNNINDSFGIKDYFGDKSFYSTYDYASYHKSLFNIINSDTIFAYHVQNYNISLPDGFYGSIYGNGIYSLEEIDALNYHFLLDNSPVEYIKTSDFSRLYYAYKTEDTNSIYIFAYSENYQNSKVQEFYSVGNGIASYEAIKYNSDKTAEEVAVELGDLRFDYANKTAYFVSNNLNDYNAIQKLTVVLENGETYSATSYRIECGSCYYYANGYELTLVEEA